MSFIPYYYRIDITAVSGSAPSDGFIDNTSVRDYIQSSSTDEDLESGWPTSLALSQAKSRANMRWQFVIQQCSLLLNPLFTIDEVAAGADASTPATTFSFTISYDRPDYLNTEDENNPGTYLTGVDAIKRFVARAMCEQRTSNVLVYDPTVPSGSISPQYHYGESVQELTVGPLCDSVTSAEASITVTQIANIT